MDQRPIFPRWMQIPRYLHRAAIPVLIILAGAHLNAQHHSWLLSIIILGVAGICWSIENPRLSFNRDGTCSSLVSAPPSRKDLALSLIRASIYAFVGDAAAAYIVYNGSLADSNIAAASNGSTKLTVISNPADLLTPNDYIQLALSASMWIIGALLWVTEPPMYWIAWRYQLDHEFDRSVHMEEGYDPLDHLDGPHPYNPYNDVDREPEEVLRHQWQQRQREANDDYYIVWEEITDEVQPPPYPLSPTQPQSQPQRASQKS